MSDEAIERLRRAVSDFGSHPEHHMATQDRHRAEWPVLWVAIDALLARGELEGSTQPPTRDEIAQCLRDEMSWLFRDEYESAVSEIIETLVERGWVRVSGETP